MPAPKLVGRVRPQHVDRYVGARIRERRIMLGLTQQQMAELIGATTSRRTSTRRASIVWPPVVSQFEICRP
jgi:transcriptional regulator with XRE-family HTH domain